ncbi:MAG: hypothetical protein ACFFD4_25435 [Candidatus Odinarchaeota archaeon]
MANLLDCLSGIAGECPTILIHASKPVFKNIFLSDLVRKINPSELPAALDLSPALAFLTKTPQDGFLAKQGEFSWF